MDQADTRKKLSKLSAGLDSDYQEHRQRRMREVAVRSSQGRSVRRSLYLVVVLPSLLLWLLVFYLCWRTPHFRYAAYAFLFLTFTATLRLGRNLHQK